MNKWLSIIAFCNRRRRSDTARMRARA